MIKQNSKPKEGRLTRRTVDGQGRTAFLGLFLALSFSPFWRLPLDLPPARSRDQSRAVIYESNMNSTIIAMVFTPSILKSPTMLRVLRILTILGFGYLGFFSWRQLQSFPPEPQPMTLREASHVAEQGRAWVIVEDIQWNCDHMYYSQVNRNTWTDIVFTDNSSELWGLAIFDREKTCDEIKAEAGIGVLDVASTKKRNDLIANGFAVSEYERNGVFLSLCTYCGRENSRLGVIVSSILILIGIWLLRIANKTEREQKLWSTSL